MGHRFAELMFTAPVKTLQEAAGSRQVYQRWETGADSNCRLTEKEQQFLSLRNSFYIASVSPDGWPYIQHRGGTKGFIKVLDEQHIGFADYRGNRQYITTGNLRSSDRVALFFMDYPNRRRLKMLGHGREVDSASEAELLSLRDPDYPATIERGFIIQIEAYDWNCPQHITPRYDAEEIDSMIHPILDAIENLKYKETP